MKRLSTLLLAAFLAATMLQLPTAAATPQGITTNEASQISTSYDDLTTEFYKKVSPQAILDSVHAELALALAHNHYKGSLPRVFTGDDASNNKRAIDLQVEAAQKIAGSHMTSRLLTYIAIDGMMNSVKDRYTVFLDPRDYAELNGDLDGGDFGGTGIVIQEDDSKYITVSNIVPDGPADKAGVEQDDLITAINGASTKGWSIDRTSAHLRGKEGTSVTLTIVRAGKLLPSPVTITRAKIHQMSAYERMLPGNVGYIALTVFGKSTADELASALDRLQKKGARAFVIDLRDNGGGYLDAAVGVSSKFISSGPIVSVESRASSITTLEANDTAIAPVPLVVLVNGHTASASEITSGAIQDSAVGTIMGTKTFGKGVVQTIFPLGDGSAVKITTARYLTPHNRDINHLGITPDIIVAENAKPRYGDPTKDEQLARALSFLGDRLAQLDKADGVTPGN
jgi:carboxyl-terminal processing protease